MENFWKQYLHRKVALEETVGEAVAHAWGMVSDRDTLISLVFIYYNTFWEIGL